MSIAAAECEEKFVVRCDGQVDITVSAELKEILLQAISSRKDLQVDLTSADALDVTAIQLLWAAIREARKMGTSFGFVGSVPEHIRCAVRDAGFDGFFEHQGAGEGDGSDKKEGQ